MASQHSNQDKSSHDLEREHYMEIRYAFVEYSAYMGQEVQRVQDHYDKLPPLQAKMLSTPMITRCEHLVLVCSSDGCVVVFWCSCCALSCAASFKPLHILVPYHHNSVHSAWAAHDTACYARVLTFTTMALESWSDTQKHYQSTSSPLCLVWIVDDAVNKSSFLFVVFLFSLSTSEVPKVRTSYV